MQQRGPGDQRTGGKHIGFGFDQGIEAVKELNAGRVQIAVRQFVPKHETPLHTPQPVIDENQVLVPPPKVYTEPFNGNLMHDDSCRRREQPKIIFGQHAHIPFRRSVPLHPLLAQTSPSLAVGRGRSVSLVEVVPAKEKVRVCS